MFRLVKFLADHTTRIHLALFFIAQISAFLILGISKPVDTQLYLEDAISLSSGELPSGRSIWYVSYSMLLALIQLTGLPAEAIVVIQIGASAIALYAVSRLVLNFTGNVTIGFLAGLIYLLWFKFYEWNLILYTDSLFTSMSIIVFWLVFDKKTRFLILPAVLFTVFLRPVGIALVICLVYFQIVRSEIKTSNIKWIIPAMLSAAFLMLILVANAYAESIMESYVRAEIIYPDIPMFIDPHPNKDLPSSDLGPVIRLALFILTNPVYFLKLFIVKVTLFLVHVKPYFSFIHNAIILLYLLPLYFFAVISAKKNFKKAEIRSLSLFILLLAIITGMTSVNWDGRFLLPVIPVVIVLAFSGTSKKEYVN